MKVLITGGTGDVGRATVERLAKNGYDVVVIGRRAGIEIPGAAYVQCDVADYEDLVRVTDGCEAIVHLAAIRNPSEGTGPEIFAANCAGTYHVYEAAAANKIPRVVTASSINAFGFFFGPVEFPLQYLPVDERHPTHTTDPYSFSKEITERIGWYYWRRDGISGAMLRLPAVHLSRERDKTLERLGALRKKVLELLSLPEADQRALMHRVIDEGNRFRSSRPLEQKRDKPRERGMYGEKDQWSDEMFPRYWGMRANFFTGIDDRDSAESIEQSLTAQYDGAPEVFVHDDKNVLGVPSEALARLFYPDVRERKTPFAADEALITVEKAKNLFGFSPRYSYAPELAEMR